MATTLNGEAVLDALTDMVNQHCLAVDGRLHSGGSSANARAMRLLAAAGRVDVERESGRIVVGRWRRAESKRPGAGGA